MIAIVTICTNHPLIEANPPQRAIQKPSVAEGILHDSKAHENDLLLAGALETSQPDAEVLGWRSQLSIEEWHFLEEGEILNHKPSALRVVGVYWMRQLTSPDLHPRNKAWDVVLTSLQNGEAEGRVVNPRVAAIQQIKHDFHNTLESGRWPFLNPEPLIIINSAQERLSDPITRDGARFVLDDLCNLVYENKSDDWWVEQFPNSKLEGLLSKKDVPGALARPE